MLAYPVNPIMGFDSPLIHVNEKPYAVAVTFFDGHQIPLVEMWTKPSACSDDIQTYPYWRIAEPRWADERERKAAWLTAQRHVATFAEGK